MTTQTSLRPVVFELPHRVIEEIADSPASRVLPGRPITGPRLPRWAGWATPLGFAVGGAVALPSGVSPGLVVPAVLVTATAFLYCWSRAIEGPRYALDRLVTAVVTSAFLVAMIPLVSVTWTVVTHGTGRLDWAFLSESMRGVTGKGGGAYHAIMGTLIVTGLASLISIPIGLLTAVYLVEYGKGNRMSRALTFFVDVMTGIPSIVAGLFAYSLFAIFAGPGVRMGIVGAVALSVLMIPILVRATVEMLKVVPDELREASLALGVPTWRTITKVVLPTSLGGIAAGVTLAIARIVGETAPLLITVGITTGVNLNPFSERMATLPVFSYTSYSSPGLNRDAYLDRAWSAALILIIVVMALNLLGRLIARRFAPTTGR
jgi:phosphate transport system permease protein